MVVGETYDNLDLRTFARDPDGDPVDFTVRASNPTVGTFSLAADGYSLVRAPVAAGGAGLTMTARSRTGNRTSAQKRLVVPVRATAPTPGPSSRRPCPSRPSLPVDSRSTASQRIRNGDILYVNLANHYQPGTTSGARPDWDSSRGRSLCRMPPSSSSSLPWSGRSLASGWCRMHLAEARPQQLGRQSTELVSGATGLRPLQAPTMTSRYAISAPVEEQRVSWSPQAPIVALADGWQHRQLRRRFSFAQYSPGIGVELRYGVLTRDTEREPDHRWLRFSVASSSEVNGSLTC